MQADHFVSDIGQKTAVEIEEEAERRQKHLNGLQLLLEGINSLVNGKTRPKIIRKDLRALRDGVQRRIEDLEEEDSEEEEKDSKKEDSEQRASDEENTDEENSDEEEGQITSNRDKFTKSAMQADEFVSEIGQKTVAEIMVVASRRRNDLEGLKRLLRGIETERTRSHELASVKTSIELNMRTLVEEQEAQATVYQSTPDRVASITFGLDQGFKGDFDLAQFKNRVDNLFNWFLKREYSKYKAPCFPVIQSSGTGKTRLFVELRKESDKNTLKDYDYDCMSFLCLEHNTSKGNVDDEYYTKMLSLPKRGKDKKIKQAKEDQKQFVTKFLEARLRECKKDKVVLLFDEAQNLMQELDGDAFRCIRWWLRQKRRKTKVVAVFAGTTSKLAHFDDGTSPSKGFSRNPGATYVNWVDGDDENNPTKQYDPFFSICNMGCLHEDGPGDVDPTTTGGGESDRQPTDFERAAFMGRPLFAQLQKARQLIGNEQTEPFGDTLRIQNSTLHAILQRMLMRNDDWEENMTALCSILGCRVQMGITTSFAMSSDLVSEGYAHLVDFHQPDDGNIQEAVARVSFMPDPVCAALGMGLMNKRWSLATSVGNDEFTGMDRKSWSQKAMDLFKSRLCMPEKGNAGEVMVALYMLFCGDVLRFELDKTLRTFSVPLSGWYSIMRKGIGNEDDTSDNVKTTEDDTIKEVTNPLYYINKDDIKADSEDDMEVVDSNNENKVDADEGDADEEDTSEGDADEEDTSEGDADEEDTSEGDTDEDDMDEDDTEGVDTDETKADLTELAREPSDMHVNFIQVCRNYFRAHSWKTQKSLEWMYKAATAAYVYEGCEAIDLVASVRVLRDGEPYYQPLLVSVKCYMNMAPGQINEAITKMKLLLDGIRTKDMELLQKEIEMFINVTNKKNRQRKIRLTKAYIKRRDEKIRKEKALEFCEYYCPPALCLLVLIGAHRQPNVPKTDDGLNVEHLGTFPYNDTFRMISVPWNDPFGVSQAVREMTTAYATTEIFSSHSFANGEDLRKPREVMRSRPRKEEFQFVQALFNSLKPKSVE
jgi:hypothetical protein